MTPDVPESQSAGKRLNRRQYHNCIARDILKVMPGQVADDFRRIGISHIVGRIWFVESTFNGQYFARPSGAEYGNAIAEGETKIVLERLVQNIADGNVLEVPGDPTERETEQLLSEMRTKGFDPSLILTNLDQSFRFWEFRGFAPGGPRKGLRSPEGYFNGIPVYHSRLLPNGLTLTLDREELGHLEVSSDFAITVTGVQDLPDREKNLVQKALQDLSEDDLKEKVRILCYEVIRPTIRVPDHVAFQAMITKGTSLRIEQPGAKRE